MKALINDKEWADSMERGKKKKIYEYIKLLLVCVVTGALILFFKWPNYIFIVLGFGFIINLLFIELAESKK